MRLILTADLHFSGYSQDKIDIVSLLPDRLSSLFFTLNEMCTYSRKNNINRICILGDLFHNKSIVYITAQSVLLSIVRGNRDIEFIVLDGNHDLSSMTGDGVSAIECLDTEKNVITIHKTTKIDNILFVPWDPKTMIDDIKKGKAEYLMSHIGLNEGMLNSGISLISDIGLKDLKQYKKVYLGHYHTPQEVGNVTYIGSAIHLDWNDKNQIKRFIDFDSDSGNEISIPTTCYTKYFEYDITESNKNEILKLATISKSEGCHIKINKNTDFDTSDIEKDFNIITKIEKDITNRGITSNMSMAEKLHKYLEIKKIPIELMEKYKKTALDIIEESNI